MEAEQFIPQNVLVIMAHPDDIEFGLAGSVAKWVAQGAKVTYCIVTDGSSGSNDPQSNLAELVQLRREEQIAAAACVGVTELIFMDYQDGTLQASIELRRDLTRLIRQIKPDRVVTFDPTTFIAQEMNYINHPDHRACGEAALYAVFPSAESRPIFPELLEEGLEPHKVSDLYLVLSDHHNTFVDISEHLESKLDALQCHRSQLGDKDLQMVRKWAEDGGKHFGVKAVEVFRVMNFRAPA